MEALKSLLSDMDLASLFDKIIPDLTTFVGWVEMALRLAIMAGPLIMMGFGLLYLLAPAKEANYNAGYRCWWGMASLESWKFTQRLAGMVWSGLGAVLTVVMALICNTFRKLEPMKMAVRGAKCIFWELILVAAACIAINIVVMVKFDKNGFRRSDYAEDVPEDGTDYQQN